MYSMYHICIDTKYVFIYRHLYYTYIYRIYKNIQNILDYIELYIVIYT